MIKFPEWVNLPKRQSKAQLATKRLRYIIMHAVVESTGDMCIGSFAKQIGMERTSIYLYIRMGRFSAAAAARAEAAYGTALIRADWLMNPLGIEAK